MDKPNDSDSSAGSRYREAGVDIDLAHTLLDRVKARIAATRRPEVLAPIGGFGGLFQLDLAKWRNPVLVSSIDSVGTKVIVARMARRHRGIGHDIVNHCINDIAVQGAEPLYFLDYIGTAALRSPDYEELLTGLAEACSAQNVTLIGGETAELPGMYDEDYDLVGCITGVADHQRLITGEDIRPGHAVLGLASNGLHTNGYSLARRIFFDECGLSANDAPAELGGDTVADALLRPHTCYWPAIRNALQADLPIHGMAHITGGGWYDNMPRTLPDGLAVECDADAMPVPAVFRFIQQAGNVSAPEMYRVFNMGVGMVWYVPESDAEACLRCIGEVGIAAERIGTVVEQSGKDRVRIRGVDA